MHKKIALVYDAIYPYIKGGSEKRYYELADSLAIKGNEVHLYGMKLWAGPNIVKKNGVFLHGICKAIPLYTTKGKRSIWQAIYFGISCLKLIREDFDVIDVNQMPFFNLFFCKIICLIKRKKFIATWNEVWGREYWKEYLGKLGTIAFIVEWFSARMPDKIISISNHTTRKLVKELNINTPIYTILVGIDFDYIQRIQPSSVKSDVIFAGRLLSHKNVDILIKAINFLKLELPQIRCLIVGDGPEKKNLQSLIKELKLAQNITLLPFLNNHDDLYALMKSSKVFVLPSIREGFGLVILEANACGIPVITADHKNNAARDLIIEGKNGYLSTLKPNDISLKILTLIINKNKYAADCINFAKKYDHNNIVNQIEEVYK